MRRPPQVRRGFTLVELLVVIGIIALLISILMPALSKARGQANAVKCASQMRDIGQQLYMYAMANKGCIIPLKYVGGTRQVKHRGGDEASNERWPNYVFVPPPPPPDYIAPQIICPTDPFDPGLGQPGGNHSYNLNGVFFPVHGSLYLQHKAIRLGQKIRYYTPSEAVLMVDKWPANTEWHLDVAWTDAPTCTTWDAGTCAQQWDKLVFDKNTFAEKKKYKHGKSGNNFLHFDFSVGNEEPRDPRDPPVLTPIMASPHTDLQ
jgi:prepilin-type N-terminal cleavage/methylation domain-containing protein